MRNFTIHHGTPEARVNEEYRRGMLSGLCSDIPLLQALTLKCARNWLSDCWAALEDDANL